MKKQDIISAYIKIRKIDNTIPDEVLDFIKQAALDKLDQIENKSNPKNCLHCKNNKINKGSLCKSCDF